MRTTDWAQLEEARDAFFADDTNPKALPIEDRELWHRFAESAERNELHSIVGPYAWSGMRHAVRQDVVMA